MLFVELIYLLLQRVELEAAPAGPVVEECLAGLDGAAAPVWPAGATGTAHAARAVAAAPAPASCKNVRRLIGFIVCSNIGISFGTYTKRENEGTE